MSGSHGVFTNFLATEDTEDTEEAVISLELNLRVPRVHRGDQYHRDQ